MSNTNSAFTNHTFKLVQIPTNTSSNYTNIKNHGEITGIIDTNGNYVVKYFYNAYGEVQVEPLTVTNVSTYNRFLYMGYYYDVETELFYCNSRYYSPELCRFISPDSIEYLDPESINGLNLYCYCMNNPVNYSDISGHAPEWLGWALTGLTLVGLTALTVLSLGTAAPITGVAASIIISATCGAYAGAITSVISQGISNGWDNISSWDILKQTAIGTLLVQFLD